MRVLTMEEIGMVTGGSGGCSSGGGDGNNLGGISDPGSLGNDLIAIYEGLVAATSYIIERVANAL
jgi:hypothetical protein